jgi:hypothetical protein
LKRPECIDLFLFIKNISFLRGIKSIDNIHHHGLAGAVGSDYRMDRAFSDFQIDTGQGAYLTEKHMDIIKFQDKILFFGITWRGQYTSPYISYSEYHSLFLGRSYIIIFFNQGENIPVSI